MKVLQHGTYYNKNKIMKCLCGCEFEYEETDIVLDNTMELLTFPPQRRAYIICPECNARTFIGNQFI